MPRNLIPLFEFIWFLTTHIHNKQRYISFHFNSKTIFPSLQIYCSLNVLHNECFENFDNNRMFFFFSNFLQLFRNSKCPSYNETISFWLSNKRPVKRSLWFALYHTGNVHTLIGKKRSIIQKKLVGLHCICKT